MKKVLFLTAIALISAACANSTEVKNTSNMAVANTNATNSQTVSEPPKEAVFTAGANPREDVISAAQKLQKLPFWSARITSATTPEVNAEMEYTAPDRFHMKDAKGEVIVIGNDSYSFNNGKWEKSEEDIGQAVGAQIKSGLEAGIKNLKDVRIVGREKFDGKDATVYSHKIGDETIKIWIANDSGLQLKNEVETNLGGKSLQITRIYDYDKKVSINAPKVD